MPEPLSETSKSTNQRPGNWWHTQTDTHAQTNISQYWSRALQETWTKTSYQKSAWVDTGLPNYGWMMSFILPVTPGSIPVLGTEYLMKGSLRKGREEDKQLSSSRAWLDSEYWEDSGVLYETSFNELNILLPYFWQTALYFAGIQKRSKSLFQWFSNFS